MKKKSIAKKLLIQCIIMLSIAFALLLGINYRSVNNAIREDHVNYSKAILYMYCDTVIYLSQEHNIPIDPAHPEYAQFIGNYLCKWHDLDYAFMCIPNIENDTFRYIALTYVDTVDEEKLKTLKDFELSEEIKYTFNPEEARMLNGEIPYSVIYTDSTLGPQLEVTTCFTDDFGNKIMAGVDMSTAKIENAIVKSYLHTALFSLGIMFLLLLLVYWAIRRNIYLPATKIANHMHEYIANGTLSSGKLEVVGNNEFAMISEAFNNMSDDIAEYIDSNRKLLIENQQKQIEVNIASTIQKGLLPSESLFLDDFNIFATMIPAKDIGGDLYDYYPLDDSRTLIVIADVSGKGFPASIFMAITITLFKQYAKLGLSPAEIFEHSNNSLSEKNSGLLFTTAFLGIYDKNTKTLTYSNAGHNLPYLISDDVRNLSEATGSILGVFPDEKYTNATVELKNGDIIFLYTDGVTEAQNKQHEFFGDERLMNCLNSYKTYSGTDIVEYVLNQVSTFSDGMDQSDDITMLSLVTKDCSTMALEPDIREFAKIRETILRTDIPRELQLNLCVIAEEILTNICNYAFGENRSEADRNTSEISFYFEHSYKIVLQFEDNGIPFNPTENVDSSEDYDIDTQIGGLGRFIAFSIADDVNYEYRNNKNILTITKYLKEAQNEH